MRAASTTPGGRDSLSKFLIRENFIPKLLPLVEMAEDLESITDLHRLCNIMKLLILLNDNTIIELVVTDEIVLGVVGALEYDPDFPTHKANHRQYLADKARYREVVPIQDEIIRRKIHHTWRLQYLKDVVLARILDDPTFSVLNSLIFYNQVDIVSHVQANTVFLQELFGIFHSANPDMKKKEDGVQFIQQCCAIAKNLQPTARGALYGNFIQAGLFGVVKFALTHAEASTRTLGSDILVALIDHDPALMRGHMLKAASEQVSPLTNVLIDILLHETDLGVKYQMSDVIKILLDPQPAPTNDPLGRANNELLTKLRNGGQTAVDHFVITFYDESARKLFQPLKDLERRESSEHLTTRCDTFPCILTCATVNELSHEEVDLLYHLVDILIFFTRQHLFRSKYFMHSEGLTARVAQLLTVPQNHLKLQALKFFRTCVGLQDAFYHTQIMQTNTFEKILAIVYETMPRDNLLNSACLELFEFIKRENIKPIIVHVVEKHRSKLEDITYVDTFQNLVLRYEQMQGYHPEMDATLFGNEGDAPPRNPVNGGQRWQGVKDMDPAEEEYFNTSDDEDDFAAQKKANHKIPTNGVSPLIKPLVDYPDEEEEAMDTGPEHPALPTRHPPQDENRPPQPHRGPGTITPQATPPPERLAEKRRREEDDEDELGKLSQSKRRSSTSSNDSRSSVLSSSTNSKMLRRKSSFSTSKDAHPPNSGGGGGGGKKMTISLAVKSSSPTGDKKGE